MDYSEACYYSTRLIGKLRSLNTENELDFTLIDKAICWAKKYHDGQFRESGEPFYTHPLEVAYLASDYLLKTDVIVASILHDIVEDTEITVGLILDAFGWRVAEMVHRLTRNISNGNKLRVEEILNNSYQAQDKEVLLIKLFDRLHNMQTLVAKSPKKIKKIADETLQIFLILATYLEISDVKQRLSELCINTKFTLQCSPSITQKTFSFAGSSLSFPQDFQNEIEQIYRLKK